MDRRFTCTHCPASFKNKNEAKRHGTSMHERTHSWSCAAVPGHQGAFGHVESSRGYLDECGFCGARFANGPHLDLQARIQHLEQVHHSDQCKRQRIFYRLDHFRQHLRHSHATTTGPWTRIVEKVAHRQLAVDGNAGQEEGVVSGETNLEDVTLKGERLQADDAVRERVQKGDRGRGD